MLSLSSNFFLPKNIFDRFCFACCTDNSHKRFQSAAINFEIIDYRRWFENFTLEYLWTATKSNLTSRDFLYSWDHFSFCLVTSAHRQWKWKMWKRFDEWFFFSILLNKYWNQLIYFSFKIVFLSLSLSANRASTTNNSFHWVILSMVVFVVVSSESRTKRE